MFCVKQRWVSFPPFDLSLALSHRVLEAAQAQSLPLSLMYLTLGCDALQLPPSCYLLCPAGRSTWHLTCPHNVPVLRGALRDRIFPSLVRLKSDNNDNDAIEQIDEDIAVTQSQVNFICPITQVEMKKPVRNKVCGHSYEQDAILKIIQTRKQQKKKVRCPKIGCSHDDVKESDLVQDEALKRAIDSQNKQSWSTL
ncbi:E3 SUMO-protein ligase NSE2 isoform X2 [Anas acuta]|uniref:E3 SUMO-protein ligase NSE2 isoform X2 n=1 Tax=Anas acuta TaxID=28680 RepID=UPI0035C896D1